jgi:hypothetical protein
MKWDVEFQGGILTFSSPTLPDLAFGYCKQEVRMSCPTATKNGAHFHPQSLSEILINILLQGFVDPL